MVNRSLNRESLPEPSHPFSRWGAGLAVSCWALGVQSFPEPWNKVGALVSAGLGYVVGQALDYIITYLSDRRLKKQQQKSEFENKDRIYKQISENKTKIDILIKERQDALTFGADGEFIASINTNILQLQKINVKLIGTPSAVSEGVKQKR
jgi:hypothetical protein